jgi:hypothetical protein
MLSNLQLAGKMITNAQDVSFSASNETTKYLITESLFNRSLFKQIVKG